MFGHCVVSSPQSTQPSTRTFESTSCFYFMEMLISFFQQDSAPAQTAKSTNTWFNDHRITLLDWPANAPDLNHHIICMGCQEEDERHKTQQYGRSEGRYRRNRGFHNTSAGQKAAMPLRINAVIHAKGAHHKNILFRRPTFKKIIFVCWSYVII